MKRITWLLAAFMLFCSHDMFLKMHPYFLSPHTSATIELYNGTFDQSDNIIDRNRIIDVSLIGNGERTRLDSSQWFEQDQVTVLRFDTGNEGTWVAGVSTRARNIELAAQDFNDYLKHDGVLDMLAWRTENNKLGQDAIEKYSKHVKTLFQVGDKLTRDWQTPLGYPIEFVPVSNPYQTKVGDDLQVRLLWQGRPLPNQWVYVGSREPSHQHTAHDGHSHDGEEHHHDATKLQTDAQGVVTINLATAGQWYVRTIHMQHSEEADLTHESNWATLTFAVGDAHTHTHGAHNHDHPHDHRHGLPWYAYLLGGILLLGLLRYAMTKSNSR